MNALAPRFGVGRCRRLGPGTVVLELLQRRAPSLVDQAGLSGRIGIGCVGDGRHLRG